ncbi:hypothetical protein QYM36_001260 [Artemia franciscana]|uniref:Carboxylesterase type B domain-containing protein n=1 Tax=Artemia franciscana TaxID=6661 RepID=A0AA88I5V5_ARTSF|nr:hypothetical protein QYM36_001260 [Artemia franciscana]
MSNVYERLGPCEVKIASVEAFLGVPYASAPVGSLRLLPPASPGSWTGVKLAAMHGPACPQIPPDVTNRLVYGLFYEGSFIDFRCATFTNTKYNNSVCDRLLLQMDINICNIGLDGSQLGLDLDKAEFKLRKRCLPAFESS